MLSGSSPVANSSQWRMRMALSQPIRNRSRNTYRGTFHLLFGRRSDILYSCLHMRIHVYVICGTSSGLPSLAAVTRYERRKRSASK